MSASRHICRRPALRLHLHFLACSHVHLAKQGQDIYAWNVWKEDAHEMNVGSYVQSALENRSQDEEVQLTSCSRQAQSAMSELFLLHLLLLSPPPAECSFHPCT